MQEKKGVFYYSTYALVSFLLSMILVYAFHGCYTSAQGSIEAAKMFEDEVAISQGTIELLKSVYILIAVFSFGNFIKIKYTFLNIVNAGIMAYAFNAYVKYLVEGNMSTSFSEEWFTYILIIACAVFNIISFIDCIKKNS